MHGGRQGSIKKVGRFTWVLCKAWRQRWIDVGHALLFGSSGSRVGRWRSASGSGAAGALEDALGRLQAPLWTWANGPALSRRSVRQVSYPHETRKRVFFVSCFAYFALVSACRAPDHQVITRTSNLEIVGIDGKLVAWLGSDEAGARLSLFDKAGQKRIQLSVSPDDISALRFLDAQGRSRLLLELAVTDARPGGVEALSIYDDSGTKRFLLGVGGPTSGFSFRDAQGKVRYVLAQEDDGGVGVCHIDEKGSLEWVSPNQDSPR